MIAQGQIGRLSRGGEDLAMDAYNSIRDVGIPPAQPLTADIYNRLEVLGNILGETNGSLIAAGDRVFGAIPRGVPGSSAQAEKPSGTGAEIIGRLQRLIELANDVYGEAQRLNNGL